MHDCPANPRSLRMAESVSQLIGSVFGVETTTKDSRSDFAEADSSGSITSIVVSPGIEAAVTIEHSSPLKPGMTQNRLPPRSDGGWDVEIGRASCRGRGEVPVV